MTKKIIVIGAGPGGYTAAIKAASLRAEVTLIEKERVGGTCLNWGCIPSKIMKTTAYLYLKFQRASEFGICLDGSVTADMAALMKRKQRIIDTLQKGILSLLRKNHVCFEQGRGLIKQMGICNIIDDQGGEKEIPFDKIILATGTSPLEIPAFPFDGDRILSSNHLLSLEKIPRSLLIVGGGVIGCEFACIFSALGAEVTVVEALSRLLPLPSVDESSSKILQREMKKRKIRVITDHVVKSADREIDGNLCVRLEPSPFTDPENAARIKPQTIITEKMAVCIGRSPLTQGLGLENIDLETDEKGFIHVNERMETSVDGVYAIGDILGPEKIMLAHVASHEALVAAQNAMGGNTLMRYDAVPSAIFTMPEIGSVGLTEAGAIEKGLDVTSKSVQFRSMGKAHAMGEIAGEAKVVAEAGTDRILGVHITGPHATDIIAEGALALRLGMKVKDIAHTIHAHPTLAEIMGEVSMLE